MGATLAGSFSTWSRGAGISLSGVEASQNGWIAIMFALVALVGRRSLHRQSFAGILTVAGGSFVVLFQVLGNRTVPGLTAGWGWWLALAGGALVLGSAGWAATLRLADLSNEPLRRPSGLGEWSGVAGMVVALMAFLAVQSILAVGERVTWPPPADAITAADAREATERFVASGRGLGDLGLDYAWTTMASIEPWPDGAEFFPRIFADIEQAEELVHIIMFGWTSGDVGTELANRLTRKLAEGIEVRILVDSLGSDVFGDSEDMYRDLVSRGAEIVVNDTLPVDRDGPLGDRHLDWSQDEVGKADHRKLYVIDGTVAWTGGAGVEDHFRDGRFHDVMVRLTGDVVLQLQSGLSHAKLVIADDTVHFGTLNLDAWSLYRDFEVAVVTQNAEAATLFTERVFDPDIALSKPGVASSGLSRGSDWMWAKLAWFL
ncbi:MAG: hypothetical protein GY929_20685 [Actinomycetia bacterium]|nr:hypothetical protein [Actinomycetes bacterium]